MEQAPKNRNKHRNHVAAQKLSQFFLFTNQFFSCLLFSTKNFANYKTWNRNLANCFTIVILVESLLTIFTRREEIRFPKISIKNAFESLQLRLLTDWCVKIWFAHWKLKDRFQVLENSDFLIITLCIDIQGVH